jgi:hypothetical protein
MNGVELGTVATGRQRSAANPIDQRSGLAELEGAWFEQVGITLTKGLRTRFGYRYLRYRICVSVLVTGRRPAPAPTGGRTRKAALLRRDTVVITV